MKRLASFIFITAIVLSLSAERFYAATATTTLESQAWWQSSGIVIPSNVGEHVHLQATVPADGPLVDGVQSIPITVTLHNQTGPVTFVRLQSVSPSGSVVERYKWSVALGPCADCSWSGTVNVDFGKWVTGRNEMRWTANIPDNAQGNRQYQSTGWQVCIRSCTPSYRTGWWTEARGWYEGRGYANARLTSPLDSIHSGGTIGVRLQPGSGGLPTKQAGVYLDPMFHAGSAGTIVKEWAGQFGGQVTLPTITPGSHRLVLVSSDGKNAGVLAIPFEVG